MRGTLCALLAGASLLALSSVAYAQEADDALGEGCEDPTGCATFVLEGLVNGFTGQAGGDLWGWMIGGGQSAGTEVIASDLENIESTLTTIANDLSQIEKQLQALQCGIDTDFIDQYAGPIQSYYETYADWLTSMQTGALPKPSDISQWANCVVGLPTRGQTCQDDKVLTLLNDLNDAATQSGGASGSIADCLAKSTVELPATGTLDDRPFYSQAVEPVTDWYLVLNTQAMTILSEAYHFRAWEDAGRPSSSSTDEIVENVCPAGTGTPSDDCVEPMTIYNNQLTPFAKGQLEIGGAPYSTDDHVLINGIMGGQDAPFLMVRSIETYNAAAGADCGDPSTTLCGPTVGPPGFSDMQSFPVGPYGFGNPNVPAGTEVGRWTPASLFVFDGILNGRFDGAGAVTLGEWLCTFGNSNADSTDCTQPEVTAGENLSQLPNGGGAGLQNVSGKGFYFPEERSVTLVDGNLSFTVGPFQCLMDGNLPAGNTGGQPICNTTRFNGLLKAAGGYGNECSTFSPEAIVERPSMTGRTMGIFPDYYNAFKCAQTDPDPWITRPGYLTNPLKYPEAWNWPVLSLDTIQCVVDGEKKAASDVVNPLGVPMLCPSAFDIWFDTQVPPGPAMTTATADATLDRSDPNTNDGAGPRLRLYYSEHRVVVGFDSEALETFLSEKGLERAQLVLSSADTSYGGGSTWIRVLPLEATFEEGDGDQLEHYRGAGFGVTWNCGTDYEIADFAEECVTEWPHRFARGYGSQVRVPDGYQGKVTFDVTEDVRNGISAWVVKRRARGGSVAFHSREGAELLGDPSLAPTLLLIDDGEDAVAENAAD
jgi:hypothetical protein